MQLINKEVRIENTNLCNAQCIICPREKMTRLKVIMPMGHFKYLVDQAKDLGAELISVFGYGEPLLDERIVERVAYCTSKGLDTFITTNGALLKIDLATQLLEAGLTKMRISAHGIYDNYERVHVGLSYKKVFRNICNFAAINKAGYDSQCHVSISVIPMNGETVEEIKDAWKGVDIEIWEPHNWCEGREYREITKKRKKTCGRVHSGPIQIQADGDVIPCCFLTDSEIVLGNTYESTIEEILKGGLYDSLRERHKSGDMQWLACDSCDQLNEGDSALLYSTVDPSCEVGKTSSTKFKLKEK